MQPFRRKLDRRQRILDFVRQAPCDFGPRCIALGLQHVCDIVKYDDITSPAAGRQPRPAQQQHLVTVLSGTLDLSFPFRRLTATEQHRDRRRKLLERWIELVPTLEFQSRELRDVGIEYVAGTVIERAQPEALIEREHAGGQIGKYALQIVVGGGELCLVALGDGARLGQLLTHGIERLCQHAEFVVARHHHALTKIPLRDGARALDQETQGRGKPFAQHERERQSGK